MCELFGMSFNKPADATANLALFRARACENPHGWGIAWYPEEQDGGVLLVKEPVKGDTSSLFGSLLERRAVSARTVMAHVRETGRGRICYQNTHPFTSLWKGKEYCFAHNGTLTLGKEKARGFTPMGDTDSESAFCHIMNDLVWRDRHLQSAEDFKWLWWELRGLNWRGTFNCILSDGLRLFCYRDRKGYRGLSRLHTTGAQDGTAGYTVASKSLTDDPGWAPLEPGSLTIFKEGEIAFEMSG